ncbi:MAG: winged helix-turn-helix transcriptional regulator [Planctomycetota bacterium]
MVRRVVNRPGALLRSTPGLTQKVLRERLDKFVRSGIFAGVQYPEIPPRVEYRLTPFWRAIPDGRRRGGGGATGDGGRSTPAARGPWGLKVAGPIQHGVSNATTNSS